MFFGHARRVARGHGLSAEGWLPDHVWLEAEASFDRAQMAVPYLAAMQRLARALERASHSCAGHRCDAGGDSELE